MDNVYIGQMLGYFRNGIYYNARITGFDDNWVNVEYINRQGNCFGSFNKMCYTINNNEIVKINQ